MTMMLDIPTGCQPGLWRWAAALCAGRLRNLRKRVAPSDTALARFLDRLLEECNRRLEEPDLGPDWPTGRILTPEEATEIVHLHFPSLTQGLEEGPVDRDGAMAYAERVEEDLSRFAAALARTAGTEEARFLRHD